MSVLYAPILRPRNFSGASRRAISLTVLALVCGLGAAGCKRAHGPDVAATVNGKPIQRTEVEKFYKSNLGDQQQQPSKEQADITRLNILRQLIDEEILQQRAASLSLVASDADVDAKISEVKAPFTQEEFDRRLKEKDLTLDELRTNYRRSLTEEKLFNKEINSKINVTDQDISSYYNAHKSDFNLIEPQYHIAQIVVTTVPSPQAGNLQNSKATNEAEARKKIQMLHNRLDSGEDFGALAINFSEDPNTASNGGDMGLIPESQLRQRADVFAQIDKLKIGGISDVVPLTVAPGSKQVGAFVIYKLVDHEAAGQRQLDDPRVQQFIRAQLRDGRSQLLKNAYIEMLRDQAHVENYLAEEIFKNSAQ